MPITRLVVAPIDGAMKRMLYEARYVLMSDRVEAPPPFFMPQAQIDTAKTYFSLKETDRTRIVESDGRVFLNRSRKLYDLALIDAYIGGFVPFHLMTKEFYT